MIVRFEKSTTIGFYEWFCVAACLVSVACCILNCPQALAQPVESFSGFYRISVDILPVHTEPSEDAPVSFNLLKNMEIQPVNSTQAEGFQWFEIKINGDSFWLKQKDLSNNKTYVDTTYERTEEVFFNSSNSDKKILVNKETRILILYEKNNNTWSEKKRYNVGLGDFSGKRLSTKLTFQPRTCLVLMKDNVFKMYEKPLAKFPDAQKAIAVVFVDKDTKNITVYESISGKWVKRDNQYKSGDKIIFSTALVWFYDDKFNIIYNDDIFPKRVKGDRRTPEGIYYIADINPVSRYGRDPDTGEGLPSFLISYPNQMDAWRGLTDGRICIKEYNRITEAIEHREVPPQNTPLGSLIMIHGGGETDWTAGCVALSNRDMKELASEIELHTPVFIK
ncbi:MAG: L,D-transpeptidase [Nitrospirae bacterium]|nr:L,D-transpeptidase [Nitrospirota bacterium]